MTGKKNVFCTMINQLDPLVERMENKQGEVK